MSSVVFYTAAISFASGIFLRSFFDVPLLFVGTLIALGLVLLLGWSRKRAPTFLLITAIAVFCVSLGIVRFDIAAVDDVVLMLEERVDTRVQIAGVIEKEVDRRARTAQITLGVQKLDGEEINARVLVLTDRFIDVSYGDRIVAEGVLEKPEAFTTDLGRTFNYPGYLSVRGISYTLSFAEVEKRGAGEGNKIISTLLSLKHTFMQSVEKLLPEPQAGLAEGLVLGVKRALGENLEQAFRITGIIHIVVLSGYNVTIVAEGIMRLLSAFFRPRTRVMFGVVAIAAFAIIAGLSATVVRASLMGSFVLLARATGRTYAIARALTVAGLAMLVINPKLLAFDPGFQLSFLATMGLIFLAPLIEARLKLVPTKFQVREFVTATIATQIFVLPLLLYSIGEFSVVAVLVNVLVLPAVPLAMLFIFLAGAVGMFVQMLAVPFALAAHILLSYIVFVAEWFAALPLASFPVPAFPFWVVVLAYAALALFLWKFFQSENSMGSGTSPEPKF